MANTPFADLYKWVKTDSKLTTIENMANNSDKIDAKLKGHNDRLDGIDIHLTTIDTSITGINTELSSITPKINDAVTATTNAINATSLANEATLTANNVITNANTAISNVNTATTSANTAADNAQIVADNNVTRWLSPVDTFSLITSTYSTPLLGDAVQVLDDGKIYRYNGISWAYTQKYDATIINNINAQLAENAKRVDWVSITEYTTAQEAADALTEGTLYIPKGTYNENINITKDNISVQLHEQAVFNGTINFEGDGIEKTQTVSLTGDWTVFPIGTTTFNGNFSSFIPDDVVLIETTIQHESYNQIGIEFAKVLTASGTQLVIDRATKFPYSNPTISKVTKAKEVIGAINKGSYEITGDFTSFLSVGDLVRIENINGVDNVDVTKAYFELNRVSEIDATKVSFENFISVNFTDVWLVGLNSIKNNGIHGGYAKTIITKHAQDFKIAPIRSQKYLGYYTFGLELIGQKNKSITPTGMDFIYCYNVNILNLDAKGSRGITDNGNIKFMSGVNINITNLISKDTKRTDGGTASIIPLFIDYAFTPYKNWNSGFNISNVDVKGNKNSGLDMWVIGVKDSNLINVSAKKTIRFGKLSNVKGMNLNTESTFIVEATSKDSSFSQVSSGNIDINGVTNTTLKDFDITGVMSADYFSRAAWIRNTQKLKLLDIHFRDSANISFYVENNNDIFIDGCNDNTTNTNSVVHGGTNTNIRYGVNDFKGTFPTLSPNISPTKFYGVPKALAYPAFNLGRNSYEDLSTITGDGTEYKLLYRNNGQLDDGTVYSFLKDGITHGGSNCKFTVPANLAGKYLFDLSLGLSSVGELHTLAELYIKLNGQKIQIDYGNVSIPTGQTKSIFLKGSVLLDLKSGDIIEPFVKVAGTSKTVTWSYGQFGGRFSGTLLFAQ